MQIPRFATAAERVVGLSTISLIYGSKKYENLTRKPFYIKARKNIFHDEEY
jgi:hypothetical protein